MADITNAFEVDEGISLSGNVLIITGTTDPTTGAGEAAPVGSLFLLSSTAGLYVKNGVGDTEWLKLGEATLPVNLLGNASSTGILTGGLLSVNTNNTKFDVAAGVGIIVDNHTDPLNPTAVLVTWPNFTAVATTYLTTSSRSFIAINSSGAIVQSATAFTNTEHKNLIVIGNLGHANLTNIIVTRNGPDPAFDATARLADLARAMGAFNVSGNVYGPNGPTLQLAKGTGTTYRLGNNFQISKKDTDTTTDPAEAPCTFIYSYRNGSGGFTLSSSTTSVNTSLWDDGSGTLQTVPNGKWTVQIVKYFSGVSGGPKTRIEYGQTLFPTKDAALNILPNPTHVYNPAFEEGVIRSFLVLSAAASDLTNTTDVEFVTASKFGSGTGGGGGSATTLQLAYNNSSSPEIVTDVTRGAVTIREGSGVGGNLFEGYDSIGTLNFAVSATGNITLVGTVDGRNVSADGIVLDNHILNTANPHSTALSQLTDVLLTAPSNGQVLSWNGTKWVNTSLGGSGTVTSVALAAPAIFAVSGSPITGSGTLTLSLTSQAANTVWAAPTGVAGDPGFRLLVAADIPAIAQSQVTNLTTDLAGKQPLDATLTSLAAFNTNGILTQTAADTFVGRTITGTGARIVVTNGDGVAGNPTIDLATAGTAGTYRSVTTDTFGRVTAGTNPTTLAGYGITDAQPLDADLTAIAALAGTSGLLRKTALDTWVLDTSSSLGTVTSVGLAAPAEFVVTNSPVTTTGTLTLTKAVQADKTVFAGPITGGPSQPTFRLLSLTNGDMADVIAPAPVLGQTLVWNGSAWIPIGGSGTGGSIRIWSGNIASSTGTTVISVGVAVPTITQGTQIASLTMTPTSTSSRYSIQVSLSVSASTNNNIHSCAVFRDTTYLGGAVQTFSSGGNSNAMSITLADEPNSALPVTYSFRYGTSANTWYINRRVAENTFGGVQSGWQIQEY